MTSIDTLLHQLEVEALGATGGGDLMQRAAAAVRDLRDALEPFAEVADYIDGNPAFAGWQFASARGEAHLKPRDFKRAKEALR